MLALGALGVVFGDIGTSPLYALQAAFGPRNDVQVTEANVLGVLSLFFWSLIVVVTVKYVLFVMRADNDGEGGIVALLALALKRARDRERRVVLLLGLLGVALFYGDGVVTPAISVLSAVEGTAIATPALHHYDIPITLAVLTSLFLVQRRGTDRIGHLFGPVMAFWFVTIAALGLHGITRHPGVLRALDPVSAVDYVAREPWIAFVSLGAVVLCLTGAEALYADMGHFGRGPITVAWLALVLPSLVLCYFGQGALILQHPKAADNPFFRLAPQALTIPLVVVATAATVIASQAVISGAFSLTAQAMQQGYVPRMGVRHTSERIRGQVYVPAVNWMLYLVIVILVLGFKTSGALAAAYGIAVTGTMAATSVLVFVVTRRLWGWSRRMSVAAVAPLLAIDIAYLGSNLLKIRHGGWFPLLFGGAVFVVMFSWYRGRQLVSQARATQEEPVGDFVRRVKALEPAVRRAPGMAVFLSSAPRMTPFPLQSDLERDRALHERIVILTVEEVGVPHVSETERVAVEALGDDDDNITLVRARFGFRDQPDVPAALRLAATEADALQGVDDATYFLSHLTIRPTGGPGMPVWSKRLFAMMSRNAASPADYFRLPYDRVVSLGSNVPI